MATPQNQRRAGLGHAADQLGQRQAGLHIPAHRVQNHQKPFHKWVLFNVHQLWNHVLILGRFLALRRLHMPFYRTDHRHAVNHMGSVCAQYRSGIDEIFFLQFLLFYLCLLRRSRALALCHKHFSPLPLIFLSIARQTAR